jgi:RHS repeat-associated protein
MKRLQNIAGKISIILLLIGTVRSHAQTNKPNNSSRPTATAVSAPSAYSSGVLVNYVRTREAVGPITDAGSFNAAGYSQVKQATQYLDGLGRPLQTVIKQGSSLVKDMVSPVVYDAYGREVYKYLPYASTTDNGNFKLNPFGEQASFMSSQYAGESIYYNETQFESSPLNRVTKTLAAGNSWGGSNRGVSMEYRLNDANDAVRIWDITNNGLTFSNNDVSTNIPATSSIYGTGQLYETHTIDESGNRVVEYKDKEGKVILKKVQVDSSPSEAHSGWLCTYYVYDDYGLLRYVIQPEAVAYMNTNGWSLSAEAINEQSFRYEYDGQNRMIAKKVPGAGWVYMVYDKRDRLAYTQDANMRSQHQWLATLYDGQNRPTTTGMITYTGNRNDLQSLLDTRFDAAVSTTVTVSFSAPDILYLDKHTSGQAVYRAVTEIQFTEGFDSGTENFETILGAYVQSTSTVLLNYDPFPSGANFTALTYTYYDDYAFTSKSYTTSYNGQIDAGGNGYPETLPSAASTLTRGQVTGTKVRVLKNPADLSQGDWLEAVNFYDDKARIIQNQSLNHKSGTDITTMRYDFTGKLITSYEVHNNAAAGQTVRTKTNMLYDHAGRLQDVKKTLNDDGNTTRYLARNSYDELGQLKEKKLGQQYGTSTEMELQAYEYNIRGWLQGMNKNYSNASNNNSWFGMELNYDYGFETNQFNGNIAGTQWRSKGDGEQRAFGYGYDKASRILFGDFNQYTSSSWNKSASLNFSMQMGDGSSHSSAYDANGNIKAMLQYGVKASGSLVIDNLSYSYSSQSNKLAYVSDAVSGDQKLGDFTNKNTGTDDYSYDVNGNLTTDKNKDISSITYNHLNLPYLITVNGKGTIQYTYDAAGNKLEKQTIETSPSSKNTQTSYLGGYVYENNVLQFFGHEEGRIRRKTDGSYVYDYFVKDHLGNTRMVLTEEQQTDAYPVASLEAATLSSEKLYYTIPDDAGTRVNKNTVAGYPSDTYTSPNDYIHKLNGNGTKVGSSMVLKVMSGDRVNIHAKSWYRLNGVTPGSPVSPLSDLVAALAGGVAQSAAGKYTAGELIGNGSLSPGMTDMLNTQSYSSTKPKAYVNWVLFDEQFKYVGGGSGFDQVGADQELKQHLLSNLPVTKNGYLYIYVSNETPNVDVFFDNLQVTHVRGSLLEETHYYPFGLTMAGISSKAAGKLENRLKFNGIEQNTDLDLNSYEAFYRTYDPQVGRFWQTDPSPTFSQGLYTAFDNNPILKNDILGDTAVTRWRSGFLGLGAKHEARYVGGAWIDSKTRNAIDPKSVRSGTRRIMNDYGKLNSVSAFSAVTDKVNNAANSVNLISGNGPASGGSEVNTPKYFSDLKAGVVNPDIDVYVSKNQSISSAIVEGNKSGQLPSYIGMGHELGHAWDILSSGSSTANFRQIPGLSPGLSNSEVNAMFWENVLRADAGMPLRTMYNYDAVRGAELPANINITNAGRIPLIGLSLQSVTLGSFNMGVTYKFLRIK